MPTAQTDVLSGVIKLIEATLKVPADKVDIDANFETFGVNSLIVMELMENIEKQFEVTLTPAQFSNVSTVRGLAELLEKLTQKSAGETQRTPSAAPEPRRPDPPAATAANVEPVASAQSAPGKPPSKQSPASPQRILDYIRREYAVDLSHRKFDAVDEIIEALASEHADAVMRRYGLIGALDHAPNPDAAGRRRTEIAIVGMSCRLPDAVDHRAFWDNLLAGKNSMREIPASRWRWEDHFADAIVPGKTVSKWGALLDDVDCFDAEFFNIPASEAMTMDPQQRLLLQETYRAVEDAGMDMRKLAGSNTGVFVGYEYSEYEHHLRKLNNKDFKSGPLFSSSSPTYYLANRLSFTFDFRGPSESINVNCASSAVAINRACYSLINGESDVAIAGGVSLNLFADDYVASSQYGVLSANGTSGVFDDDANGFTRGEGAAALVLKRLEDAERDNDRIYAVIKACHQNYRGAARNISEIKYESIADALSKCYEKAGVDVEAVSYIEVDGYATKWGDSFEYEGVKGAFANSSLKQKHCALGSLKGNIGNVESVSGAANVIKVALSLFHKKFPATVSKKKINSFIDIDNPSHPLYIADSQIAFEDIRKDAAAPIRAGVNSFADSGVNVHILLEEYMAGAPVASVEPPSKQLFVLSAKNGKRLENYVADYVEFLSKPAAGDAFADFIYTAQTGREALSERLAIVASSREELLEKLLLVKKTGIRDRLGLESKDIYHGRSNPADKNSLASLITAEMAYTQLAESMRTLQWRQAALLWVNGVSVPWETVWRDRPVRRASLPAYPFAKERYWVDVEVKAPVESVAVIRPVLAEAQPVDTAPALEWWFYVPSAGSTGAVGAVAMSRVEKIELFLKQEIARQLKSPIEEIPADRNFIDLGMNSIGVADLIIKTDKLLQANLSPSVLFKHPDIGSLAQYLAQTYAEALDALIVSHNKPAAGDVEGEGASRRSNVGAARRDPTPQDILVPLQTKGDRTPLFAVPGAGGGALSLQQLSHALGGRQPFYCLEAVGLDGVHPPMASIEEIAQFNIRALRSVQSKGPYRVLGYSNGGVVAFEMARRLVEQEQESASLILLDSLCPLLPGKDPVQEMVDVFKHFVASLGGVSDLSVKKLRETPESERSAYLYDSVVGLGFEAPREQFIATFNAATASERACRAYRPSKLSAALDATLFRADAGYPDAPEDYGWNQLLAQPLRTYAIKADHFSIIDKHPLKDVARRINLLAGKSARKPSSAELEARSA